MIWIGLAIVILTFYLIYKNYEARLVLALSGILMAAIGWLRDPMSRSAPLWMPL